MYFRKSNIFSVFRCLNVKDMIYWPQDGDKENNMRILHMADVHLGAEPDKDKPWGAGRGKLQWDAFGQAIRAAEEQRADLVLIAGDLFHRQPLKKELKEVNYILSGLSHTKVVIMAGNHDYLSKNSFYRNFPWNENIYFLKSEQMEALHFPELGATVYGFSYEHREIREKRYCNLKKQGPGYHILLAHGGDDMHVPVNAGELMNMDFDYIAMGHIHKPQQLLENRIVMAGALKPLDHNDTGPHGYWVVELKKDTSNAIFYPIRGCEYTRVEVELDGTNTNRHLHRMVQERVEELAPYQLARVVLTGIYDPELPPEEETLREIQKVVAVEKLCKPNYNFQKLKQEYAQQLLGRFIKELEAMPQDEVTRKAMYLGVDALMGNSDVY